MNWGYSLLTAASKIFTILSELVYNLKNIIWSLLYGIWRLIAFFIDQVESVFRNLAGVGKNQSAGSNDMATEIITNPLVESIFWNLVAISTALMIFFTIIKIIQDHYKQKDAGNPYMTVFKMFKGMLMFFFVTAAVLVGIQASNIAFRGLDYATGGGGDRSLSGQVFIAMAQDANRKKRGIPDSSLFSLTDRAERVYYYRLINGMTKFENTVDQELEKEYNEEGNRKYVVVQMDGDVSRFLTENAWREMDMNRYGIVQGDQVVPLSRYLGTFATEDDRALNDYVITIGDDEPTNQIGGYYEDEKDDDLTEIGGKKKYKNDFLQGFTLKITPRIDFEWSPISIQDTHYEMQAFGDYKNFQDITVSFFGSGTTLHSGYQNFKFKRTDPQTREFGESQKKVFALTANGKVSLRNSEAAASFSLKVYHPQKFEQIIMMIFLNNLYTRFGMYALDLVPAMPLLLQIGPLEINLTFLLRTAMTPLLDTLAEGAAEALDSDPKTIISTKTNGGTDTWIKCGNSLSLPVDFMTYGITSDFENLYKQLLQNRDRFVEQIGTDYTGYSGKVTEEVRKVDAAASEAERMIYWQQYKGYVDDYNNSVYSWLDKFSDAVYVQEKDQKDYDDVYEASCMYLAKESLKKLVSGYISFNRDIVSEFRPTYDASTLWVPHLYKPVFVFKGNDEAKAYKTIDDATTMTELLNFVNNNCTINLCGQPHYGGSYNTDYYRLVDWSVYGSTYKNHSDLRTVADLDDGSLSTYAAGGQLDYRLDFLASQASSPISFAGQGFDLAAGKFGAGHVYLEGRNPPEIYPKNYDLNTADVNLRPSSALANALSTQAAKIFDDFVTEFDAASDEPTASTEFTNNIITFRELYPAEGENNNTADLVAADKVVLRNWVTYEPEVNLAGNLTGLEVLANVDATRIDALMASKAAGRRYLMLSKDIKDGDVSQIDDNQLGKYVGTFSYDNLTTVNALYDMSSMHFIVGFICLITAMGVYTNFVFGLIQRVVNMAVLYMMSPLTIAFYPFDDGSKFDSVFIKPFYKETISAFSIIISLNIFIVLVTPITNAAKAAVSSNGTIIQSLVGVLALTAFVSMLPRIRDTISGVMGANSIQSKKIGDMFKDANNSLGNPAGKAKVAAGYMWGRHMQKKALGETHDQMEKDRLENKRKNGGLSWLEQKRLDRLQRKAPGAMDGLEKALAAGRGSEAYKALSDTLKGMFDKQEEAATKKAKKNLGKNATTAEIEAERDRLMADKDFVHGFNGVLASNKPKMADKLKVGLGNLRDNTEHTGLGQNVSYAFDKLKENKTFGGFLKMTTDKRERDKVMEQYRSDYMSRNQKKFDDEAEAVSKAEKNIRATEEAEKAKNANRNLAAASEAVGKMDRREKLLNLLRNQLMTDGDNPLDQNAADLKANEFINQLCLDADNGMIEGYANHDDAMDAEIEKLGGKGALINGMAIGAAGFVKMGDEFYQTIDKMSQSIEKLSDAELKKMTAGQDTKAHNAADDLYATFAKETKLTGNNRAEIVNMFADALKSGASADQVAKDFMQRHKDDVDSTLNLNEASIADIINKAGFKDKKNDVISSYDAQALAAENHLAARAAASKTAASWAELGLEAGDSFVKAFQKAVNDRSGTDASKQGTLAYEREELNKKLKNGDISLDQYNTDLKAAEQRYVAAYDKALQDLMSSRGSRIHDYHFAERTAEFAMNQRSDTIAKEIQKIVEYHVNVNMDVPAMQAVLKDTVLAAKTKDGNLAEGGRLMKEAAQMALQGNMTGLRKVGLDESTVQKFMEWSGNASGRKRLNSISELGDLRIKFMGDPSGNVGGDSISGVFNAMGSITQMSEMKAMADKFDTYVQMQGNIETQLRNSIDQYLKSAKSLYASDEYGKAFDLLLEDNNQAIQTLNQKYRKQGQNWMDYVTQAVERASMGSLDENSEESRALMDALGSVANGWGKEKLSELKIDSLRASSALQQSIDNFTGAFRANAASNNQDFGNNESSWLKGKINENMQKINAKSPYGK